MPAGGASLGIALAAAASAVRRLCSAAALSRRGISQVSHVCRGALGRVL